MSHELETDCDQTVYRLGVDVDDLASLAISPAARRLLTRDYPRLLEAFTRLAAVIETIEHEKDEAYGQMAR